jgi:3-dehydroquinate synthase
MDTLRRDSQGEGSSHGFSVPFAFPVHFTRNAWDPSNPAIIDVIRRHEPDRRHRILVVIDEHVARAQPRLPSAIRGYVEAHSQSLDLVSEPVLVPGGEAVKNDLAHPFNLLQVINDVGLDRQSCIVVIGGGAVLDMVSFAAAIAHRGIRVLRLPTTVLAQGDSGIAVKNSVNLFGKKNFIGTFVPPFGVVNDTDTLDTLPRRDKIAGISEAVKVALLRDPDFFRYIESNARLLSAGDSHSLAYVVQRSAELHLAHICGNGDPFELGSARPLDFGHWSAHKLETMTCHRVRHGEAVAIGMALDLTYAVSMGFLDASVCERILRLLEAIGLPLWDGALLDRTPDCRQYAIQAGLQEFREHLGGDLHITLLRDVGNSFEVTEMDDARVADAIEALAHRALRHSAHKPIGVAAGAAL